MREVLKVLQRLHAAVHHNSLSLILLGLLVVLWAFRPAQRVDVEAAAASDPAEEFVLVIEKDQGRLLLYCDSSLLGIYSCAVGDPERAATPSGRFRIHHQRSDPQLGRAFVLDYPTIEIAQRALEVGWIGRAELAQIETAHQQGVLPPQNTRLGPAIEIHGGGVGNGAWTAGNVALEDHDLDQLAPFLTAGTRVVIR